LEKPVSPVKRAATSPLIDVSAYLNRISGRRTNEEQTGFGLVVQGNIETGLKAVDASPFKTVFVVEEQSGVVLFALSKNEEYVQACRKKQPNPDPPPPPAASDCCKDCYRKGGYNCSDYPDGSCICWGAKHENGGGNLGDELGTLAS